MAHQRLVAAFSSLLLSVAVLAQQEPDRDGDGLADFAELHKYLTDPSKADSDGDGTPDGDWRERREYQYTVRTVVQVMRPVTIEFLTDDHQDARVLDATASHVELEVIHYPFTTVASTIVADPDWRQTTASMNVWTAPGPTADWTPAMRRQLFAALLAAGIDANRLDDKGLVEQAARWLCAHAKGHDAFSTFVTAFDAQGKPRLPSDLAAALPADGKVQAELWAKDISARGMFERGLRGSCSSSAIYLNGCLRALGIPTRIVLCIPVIDANDAQELRLLEKGITHHALREGVAVAIRQLAGQWASHSFNEVFVGGRWRRLNYDRLGQDITDSNLFGLMTHVATFSDWADARMPETIGRRQALRRYDDLFGGPNPYSAIAVRDEFGPHCKLANPPLPPLVGTVAALQWGDSPELPDDVRGWFVRNGFFGLVARIEGPKNTAELRRLLAEADARVRLVTEGKPTIEVGLDAHNFWWRGDHAFLVVPFGPADRQGLAPDTEYRFVPRNDGKQSTWQAAEGLVAPRRR